MEITVEIAARLVREQFPQWADLPVRPVEKSGHDNRTFRLGEEMTVRIPSGPDYVPQVEKEAKWLPFLADRLSLPVPRPLALGKPAEFCPVPWSVNRYLEGKTALAAEIPDKGRFAEELAGFLAELQRIDAADGPAAGRHNFYRGASPAVYRGETEAALTELQDELPVQTLRGIWERALASVWQGPPVWIHGDVAPGNLLVKDGRLCGVIDFGILGTGDPACDYAMAWTFFDPAGREIFLRGLDRGLIDRARGWALWKALITYRSAEREQAENAADTISAILAEEFA